MGSNKRLRKLKWLCRRGMKELDILLERFIENQQHALSEGAWPELESLLQSEDDVLWNWLQDPSRAESRAFRKLLEQIRRGTG